MENDFFSMFNISEQEIALETISRNNVVVVSNGSGILELNNMLGLRFSDSTYLYLIPENKIQELKNIEEKDVRALGVVFMKPCSTFSEVIQDAYLLSWKFFNSNFGDSGKSPIFFEKEFDCVLENKTISEINNKIEELIYLRNRNLYKQVFKVGSETLALLEEVPEENFGIDLFSKLYCVITKREHSDLSLSSLTNISEKEAIYEKLISEYKNAHDLIYSFRKFINCFCDKANSYQNESNVKSNEAKIIEIMQENYMDDLNLSKVSRAVELSNSYVAKLIKDHTGENFTDCLNEIRLKNAENLLKNTEMSVNDISYYVGFNYPSYFRRIFKKKNNVTAKEYREMYKSI